MQLLRCGSSGWMKGCALRWGKNQPSRGCEGTRLLRWLQTTQLPECRGLLSCRLNNATGLLLRKTDNSDFLPVRDENYHWGYFEQFYRSLRAPQQNAPRISTNTPRPPHPHPTLSVSLTYTQHSYTCARGSTNPISNDRCET